MNTNEENKITIIEMHGDITVSENTRTNVVDLSPAFKEHACEFVKWLIEPQISAIFGNSTPECFYDLFIDEKQKANENK